MKFFSAFEFDLENEFSITDDEEYYNTNLVSLYPLSNSPVTKNKNKTKPGNVRELLPNGDLSLVHQFSSKI